MAASTLTPNDSDADTRYAPHHHDNLGVHPERAEAEAAELERMYGADSAPERKYGSRDLAEQEKGAANDTLGSGFTHKKSRNKLRAVKLKSWNKKKAAIVTSITGTLVGGGMFGATMLSVPAHLIQNAHILQAPFTLGNDNSALTYGRLFRFARVVKGGLAETRINLLESKYLATAKADLAKNGVTIRAGFTGYPTRTDVDVNKLKNAFPELKNADDEQIRDFLASKMKIPSSDISGSGTKFWVDQTKYDVGAARLLNKSTIANLGDGSGIFAIKTRAAMKAWRLPSGLLHPLDKRVAQAERSALLSGKSPAQVEETAAEAESAKVNQINEPITARGAAAVEDVKASAAKYNSVAMKALLFTGGVCMIRDVADKVITVNRAVVAEPAAAEALRMIAVGEQAQYGGDDTTMEEMHIIENNMGQAYESAQAYEALADGSYHSGDPDIPADYQQAFSTDTTAKNIRDFASKALGGDAVAGSVCSPVGIGVQIAGGLALSLGSVVAEVGSVGALTPAVVGVWAVKEGVSFAVSAVAMHFVQNFIVSKSTAKLAADAFNGPQGANLVAYGAREAANMTSISSGGVDLGNKSTTIGWAEQQQTAMQQFRSEGFFARMFSPYNSRSLLGHFMLDVSPSFSQNIAAVSGSVINIGSTLRHTFASFLPKAAADAKTHYNWTFGQAGLPDSIKNDPKLQDPYANADVVAGIFDASCNKDDVSSCDYAKRISSCFGNTLSYADGMWDVTSTHEVNEHSDDYLNANCDQVGTAADTAAGNNTGIWRRMLLFVNDTSTIKAAACSQGSTADCPGGVAQ